MAYKHVTPALVGAQVPDLVHGGHLPAAGLDVVWTPYWAALEARGDVTAYDVPDPVDGGTGPTPGPALADDVVVLLQVGGVNLPFTLAQLRAFLGATGGSGGGTTPAADPGPLDLSGLSPSQVATL